jgi:hypothetical protein
MIERFIAPPAAATELEAHIRAVRVLMLFRAQPRLKTTLENR